MHKEFGKDHTCSGDILVDRQTCSLQYFATAPAGKVNIQYMLDAQQRQIYKKIKTSQCSTVVLTIHCCKGDQLSLWRMAHWRESELQNPWTDCHTIWHWWLRRRYHPACKLA